jgi:two-component sensor histidine kinase
MNSYSYNSARVGLETDIDNISLGIDTAISIGLIINELLSNALKYAFPDNRRGEIKIIYKAVNYNYSTLIVCDNGKGFPEDIDFKNTESLGLQLVNTLVSQLEGTIELLKNGGTEFKITLPNFK